MDISVHGTTYTTPAQMAARVTELTYKNRVHGESDGRVTELNMLFDAMESLAVAQPLVPADVAVVGLAPAQRTVITVLQNQTYLTANDAPVLTLEVEYDIASYHWEKN